MWGFGFNIFGGAGFEVGVHDLGYRSLGIGFGGGGFGV